MGVIDLYELFWSMFYMTDDVVKDKFFARVLFETVGQCC